MTAWGVVYVVGAGLGGLVSGGVAIADDIDGKRPRVVLANLARRILLSVCWPISLPVYVLFALVHDEW